ncbi:MAG: hypothetical protein IPI60_14725 [Saprospiraceae bacterium]|nr:hypothetical protein [Saprospiraceae bacterium]
MQLLPGYLPEAKGQQPAAAFWELKARACNFFLAVNQQRATSNQQRLFLLKLEACNFFPAVCQKLEANSQQRLFGNLKLKRATSSRLLTSNEQRATSNQQLAAAVPLKA